MNLRPNRGWPQKLSLANLPTRIERLEHLSRALGREIYLWRDDLTGFLESGNKVRKLEFVLKAALDEGATRLITCGGPQSNHVRATVVLARRLGLEITVAMRDTKDPSQFSGHPNGNLLLDRIFGATLIHIPYVEYVKRGSVYDSFLEEAAERSRARGERPFIIPEGASSPLGCFGYLTAVEELKTTWKSSGFPGDGPDSLFLALGSGGTHAGLALGFEHFGLGARRVWAVNVCDNREYFQKRVGRLIEDTIHDYHLPVAVPPLQILDGYVGRGYGLATSEELSTYVDLARTDGILLDPVYSGKAFHGMIAELKRDSGRFGRHVLFLHSGGLLATFAYADQYAAL